MAQRGFAVLAFLATTAVVSVPASAQVYSPAAPQSYPSNQGYGSQSYPSEPRGYQNPYAAQRRAPNFDALDDDDDNGVQGSTALSTPGPVMSPEDPRYGRPMNAPPQNAPSGYAERPAPYSYSDRSAVGSVPSDRAPAYGAREEGVRPPQALGAPTGEPAMRDPSRPSTVMAALPPEEQPDAGPVELPPHLRRQEVNYVTKEPPGTIIVDTANTHLYLVLGGNRAMRYGVRVGRDGFTWNGVQKITRKAEWPDWHPPSEMIERQPYLPRFMAGGDGNPMGARAMYLGSTVYRIHGTNQPSTIGKFVSSGCVGMLNEDVSDLFERVKVGTRVVVLPGGKPGGSSPAMASAQDTPGAAPAQGGVTSYPPTNYTPPPQGSQPPPAYRGDGRNDATSVAPLPPPVVIR
jgi:lipoprotein-anchoring transpeptidase ErfK/SrfK